MNPSAKKPSFATPDTERGVKLDKPARSSVKFSEEQPEHKVSPGTKKLLTRKPTPFSNDLQRQIRDSGLAAWAAAEKAKEEVSESKPILETVDAVVGSTADAPPNGTVASGSGSAAPADSVAGAKSAQVKATPPSSGT